MQTIDFFVEQHLTSLLQIKIKQLQHQHKQLSIIIPKNSAPIIIKRHEILIKSKIKKKTE